MKSLDETVLVQWAQSDDREALRETYSRYAVSVRKIVLSVVGPTPELEDLVQDIFLNIYRSLPGFRGAASFSTWLFRIAVNTAISHLRKPKRLVLMAAPDETFSSVEKDTLQRAAEGREMLRRMYAILDTMSAKRRVALTLFEFQGLSLEEMSAVLKVPKAHRGLAHPRQCLIARTPALQRPFLSRSQDDLAGQHRSVAQGEHLCGVR